MLKHPHPLPNEQLQKMSTQRLLEVLKVARSAGKKMWLNPGIPNYFGLSSQQEWEVEDKKIGEYVANIKAELDKREHVPDIARPVKGRKPR